MAMAQLSAEQIPGLIEAAALAADAASRAANEMKKIRWSEQQIWWFFRSFEGCQTAGPVWEWWQRCVYQELTIWRDFVLNLKSWLYFADAECEKCLDAVEKDPKTVVNLIGVATDVLVKSNKLYSILSGLLTGF